METPIIHSGARYDLVGSRPVLRIFLSIREDEWSKSELMRAPPDAAVFGRERQFPVTENLNPWVST